MMTVRTVLNTMWDRAAVVLATGLGIGFFPVAPGTAGTLLAVPVAWGLHEIEPMPRGVVVLLLIMIGIPICTRAGRVLAKKDPGEIVFDEIAAFQILFLGIPWNVTTAALGFLLFRLFDVTKVWPAKRLEHLPEGLGIIADDVAAAIYATAVLGVIVYFLPATWM